MFALAYISAYLMTGAAVTFTVISINNRDMTRGSWIITFLFWPIAILYIANRIVRLKIAGLK